MESIQARVTDFFKNHGMDHKGIDLEKDCKVFMEEMEDGLSGISGSLKMLPTYISLEKDIPLNKPVIVIDAGGTNFRSAVVHFDDAGKPVISNFMSFPMPGSKEVMDRDEFFNTMADYIMPVIEMSDKIGFCFSYPAHVLPNRDGRLLQLSKELHVKGVIGENIGENLLKAVNRKGHSSDKSVVLLNDTVATLLGGRASFPGRVFESYIGFILGTGTNTCYIEDCSNVSKLSDLPGRDKTIIINVESGGYKYFARGDADMQMDAGTSDPGEYLFEKMVSGRYLPGLLLMVIKMAAKEGLFSEGFQSRIKTVTMLSPQDADNFLYYPYSQNILASCCSSESGENENRDHITLYYLIDSVIERAAKAVTVNLASLMLKTGKGSNPCKPVLITAEGSTFYKSKLFKAKLDYYVYEFLNKKKGIFCEFAKVEDATLIGTAIAGLTN